MVYYMETFQKKRRGNDMLSRIINVIIVVASMSLALYCLRYSISAFMQKGKIPLNIYDLINDGKKRNLANMSDEDRKKSYITAGFVFMGFAIALIFLMTGFLIQMFGGNGGTCFMIAIGVEVVELILIAILIRRK